MLDKGKKIRKQLKESKKSWETISEEDEKKCLGLKITFMIPFYDFFGVSGLFAELDKSVSVAKFTIWPLNKTPGSCAQRRTAFL